HDYLGSTALVTSPDGLIFNPNGDAGRIEYDPYGATLVDDLSTARIKQRFNGKELDETGLSYYGGRYADLHLGRWLARDAVSLSVAASAIRNSQAANLYAFSDNSPAARVDKDGNLALEATIQQITTDADVIKLIAIGLPAASSGMVL